MILATGTLAGGAAADSISDVRSRDIPDTPVRRQHAPRLRAGEFAYVDPDEPAVDGCLVAVWDGEPRATTVRLYVEEDGRRVLRALDRGDPDRVVEADNETDIRGVVVFRGRKV